MSDILTLKVYFAERERSGDRFLADAMLDLFEKRAIATSIMLRGIASFGPTNILRSDRSLSLSEDPPVTISAIDTADKITALADDVAALTRRGVITVERERESASLPHDTVRMTLHLGRRHRIGGVGAVLRFLVDRTVSSRVSGSFPYGTFAVNISGALLLGFLSGLALSPHVALLAGTAFVGSYTTFSTWMLETQRLGEERQLRPAVANIVLSLVLGLAAAGLGLWIGGRL